MCIRTHTNCTPFPLSAFLPKVPPPGTSAVLPVLFIGVRDYDFFLSILFVFVVII